jgi:hypothetical protein
MTIYCHREKDVYTLAIGIKGKCSSFCGAIKRFEDEGTKWNGLLTLKEQCARRIALLKNEQLKCIINAYLSPALFEYVTKDIFNIQRQEFTSNYPKKFYLCHACSVITHGRRQITCACPRLKIVISKLNKHFSKRINAGKDATITDKLKKFELIYKLPDDENGVWTGGDEPICFFLFLSPPEYHYSLDTNIIHTMDFEDYISSQSYRLIGQASVEEKLLFVDIMRFFGGFETDHKQPQLMSCHRKDIQH